MINQPPPPERSHSTRLHVETVAVTAGRPERAVDAPLNPPVVFASTYVGAHDPGAATLGYGRYSNPTWQALEQAIGALEGGRALTFASGMAAAHAVLELLPPDGVIAIPHNCYVGVAEAIDRRARRYGWQVRRVNVADTTEVLTAAEGADMVWIESPTNPTIEVADLPTLGQNLSPNSIFVVDNTFATPLLQRPLDSGADIVLHSATKLLSGHSDVVLGAIVTRADDASTFDALDAVRRSFGASPGPMEAYLALRGLRTLPLRLAQAQASAQVLAERLVAHRHVQRVRFPGTIDRSWSRPRAAHHVWLWLGDLNRSCGREGGRGLHRWLLTLGLRHQPRWSRVHAGATATLGRRIPVGAGRSGADVGWDRTCRGPLERPCGGSRSTLGVISNALVWPSGTSGS